MNNLDERLRKLGACEEAINWSKACTFISDEAAWRLCPKVEWLWWLLDKTVDPRRKKLAWWCAERARGYAVEALIRAGFQKEAKKLEKAPARKWEKAAYAAYTNAAYTNAAYADALARAACAAYAAAYAALELRVQRDRLLSIKPPKLV